MSVSVSVFLFRWLRSLFSVWMMWFLNRNNTFSLPHSANNERAVSLLVVYCGLLSTPLPTIKKNPLVENVKKNGAIFNMILSVCDSVSSRRSQIFNLKIKHYARFSTFRMDSWPTRPHSLRWIFFSFPIVKDLVMLMTLSRKNAAAYETP